MQSDERRYSFLPSNRYCLNGYCLVPLREEDIELIRKWRNGQIDYLRQDKLLTKHEQIAYYNQVIKKSFYEKTPGMVLFSFTLENNCIGYGGFVHINWKLKKAELSFLLDTNRTKELEIYKKEFGIFLKIILGIGFKQIFFNKIFTETFDVRPNHVLALEKAGFVLQSKLRSHVNLNDSYADSLLHEILIKDYVEK